VEKEKFNKKQANHIPVEEKKITTSPVKEDSDIICTNEKSPISPTIENTDEITTIVKGSDITLINA